MIVGPSSTWASQMELQTSMAHIQNISKENWLKTFKAVVLILCITGFALNTWETIKKYKESNEGSTFQLTFPEKENELPMPVFVLCNETAYKRKMTTKEHSNLNFNETFYMNQTKNPDHFMPFKRLYFEWHNDEKRLVNYTTQELRTTYHGRCLAIKIDDKVWMLT